MAQQTLVIKVPKAEHEKLRKSLPAAEFEFRTVPHAVFSAKGQGVVVTLYSSGKLVVQGQTSDVFVARYLPEGAEAAPAKEASASKTSRKANFDTSDARPRVGSDECGKGDYFGPLIVCAVRLTAKEVEELRDSKVGDSKTFSDKRAREIGAALRGRYAFSLRLLNPADYNAAWGGIRNVNEVLSDLHAEALREMHQPGDRFVVDRFASESLLERRLSDLEADLEQRPRAEDDPAVACASLIAREAFLMAMDELSSEAAIPLPKGAGAQVDTAARELVELHGEEALGRFAKLHFKNTSRVLGRESS